MAPPRGSESNLQTTKVAFFFLKLFILYKCTKVALDFPIFYLKTDYWSRVFTCEPYNKWTTNPSFPRYQFPNTARIRNWFGRPSWQRQPAVTLAPLPTTKRLPGHIGHSENTKGSLVSQFFSHEKQNSQNR